MMPTMIKGVAGQIASAENHNVKTFIAKTDIPFGACVHVDTETNLVSAGGTFGVALRNPSKPNGYKKGDTVSVLVFGTVWALANEDAKKWALNTFNKNTLVSSNGKGEIVRTGGTHSFPVGMAYIEDVEANAHEGVLVKLHLK